MATMQENAVGWTFTLYHIQKLKWIKDLNLRAKIIKLLEWSTGENIHSFEFGSGFLSMTLKAQVTEEKID